MFIIGNSGLSKELRAVATLRGYTVIRCIGPELDDRAMLGEFGRDALIGVGHTKIRQAIARRFGDCDINWITLIHPRATVDGTVGIGRGTVVCAGAVITDSIRIGDHCLINIGATIGHDVKIGDCCILNPGCHVSGGCEIGHGVLVGVGASVLQGLRIGDGATVGAGAVVTSDVAPGSTVVGIPARPTVRLCERTNIAGGVQ